MLRVFVFLSSLVLSGAFARAGEEFQESPIPSWIWSNPHPAENERVFFRREFQLPPDVVSASITVACDDWQRLTLNGQEIGMASQWNEARSYDVLAQLNSDGGNIINVEARNERGPAAMSLHFKATFKDGKILHLVSDNHWSVNAEALDGWMTIPFDGSAWPRAVIVAKMGDEPWGNVMPREAAAAPSPEPKIEHAYKVAPGFKLEQLYHVPKDQGSWVAMTVDDKGRLICSDQYGSLYRVTLSLDEMTTPSVEKLSIPLKGAHGLLWHAGILWVSIADGEDQNGVWKVTDSDGDGELDKPELIKALVGSGEHGPHALVLSPDGKYIYLAAGNHTDMPGLEKSLTPKNWAEDQLLPRRPDARGHARDRMAPGGFVARFQTDGTGWEVFSIGFRNHYDMAFNEWGDLFCYDSDMEWDLGMPWYRPTRICHITPGSEFGWRNGTGVWPDYYEDSMPSQLDIGPGSPTGMVSGKGAKFPARYQRALFALDWTFATLYAIHLTPEGAGYRAEREEMISGSGLPFTDAAIGKGGSMFFLTGGRRGDSNLWRVSYVGAEDTSPVEYRNKDLSLMNPTDAVTSLGSEDRIARYQARVALEAAGPSALQQILEKPDSSSWQILGASFAMARVGSHEQSGIILDALDRLDWAALQAQQKITYLRALGLTFARHGTPAEAVRNQVLAKIDAAFPADTDILNRELCRMLCYLQAPNIVPRTLALMESVGPSAAPDWLELAARNHGYGRTVAQMIANLPPAQIIHYIYCLRVVPGPWQKEERSKFFAWFDKLTEKKGGESYAGFIFDLKKQTLATATEEEREWLAKMESRVPVSAFANLPEIKGPGREWSVDEVVNLAEGGLDGRDRENGKRMYQASLCAACHRFGSEGGATGPDLTALSGRFSIRDIATAILEPNQVVSDQYAFDLIIRNDGTEMTGKILEEKDEKWIIATSPFDLSQTSEIQSNDIQSSKLSPISPMPPGLINRLSEEELKDLLAYLMGK